MEFCRSILQTYIEIEEHIKQQQQKRERERNKENHQK